MGRQGLRTIEIKCDNSTVGFYDLSIVNLWSRTINVGVEIQVESLNDFEETYVYASEFYSITPGSSEGSSFVF